jgi:outer membrane autotransporter protein
VPVATDDVIFRQPSMLAGGDFNTGNRPFQPLVSGQVIVLFPSSVIPPPLVANSLTFQGNYTLVSSAEIFNQFPNQAGVPLPVEPLTLTSGNVTVAGTFTATINNPLTSLTGTVTKLGTGTLILNNANASGLIFSPSLINSVAAGPAAVIGNVVVQQGTLGGNFSITGNLLNFATLSPGDAPGSIDIGGNYLQSKGAKLSIGIASPTLFDTLLIGGNAKLAGTLDVSLINGFTPKQGEKFTFLGASGISGKFTTVFAPVWNDLTLRPFYGKETVTLKTVVASFAAVPGLNANERAVGRSLDSANTDPRAAGLLNYLYDCSLHDLPQDLEKLTPDGFASMLALGPALGQVQSLNLQRHTADVRSGSSGFSASNLAINGSNPFYSGGFDISTGVAGPSGDDGKEVKEAKEVTPAENRWGAFLSGTGEWVNVSGSENARGFDLVSGGFTLGVDYKLCPNFAVGLAAGYLGTTADLTDHGRVWVNGGKLGIYATTFAGGWYADVAAFGGYNSYSTRRSSIEGEARGDTDGGELNALFGTGYDCKAGGFTFGPTATFNDTHIGFNDFTEHNSLAPLDIHGANLDSYRSAFGARVSYDCKCGSIIIRPELRAAWQHEYGGTSATLTSSFADGAGDPFTTRGPQLGRDSALIGAGFAIQFNDRLTTYLYYDGQLGRENFESNAVMGGVRVTF